MAANEMKEAIAAKAMALGFERVGFATADALEREKFERWLAEGFHGAMGYMARRADERLDPRRYLEGARAVVVVAKNYYTPPNGGSISRYAQGDDYHDVLTEKLRALAADIEAMGARARACVDTAPVLEKAWAVRAGLGWQGKHSNVITKSHASWVFLGEIVTDAAIEPDAPFTEDLCGTCTRCIDLCPTRAIVAPYVVDSRRCIAYLTIEHRGAIDRDLRPLMDDLIFGCDICQDVCPWNKFAQVTPEAAFEPRAVPALAGYIGMTDAEFRARFKGSPVLRAKRGGFLRNVCIALGNSGDGAAIEPLTRALKDGDPLVRQHAAWGLGELGATEVLKAHIDDDPAVREEVTQAVARGRTREPGRRRPILRSEEVRSPTGDREARPV